MPRVCMHRLLHSECVRAPGTFVLWNRSSFSNQGRGWGHAAPSPPACRHSPRLPHGGGDCARHQPEPPHPSRPTSTFHGVRALDREGATLSALALEYLPRLKSWQFYSHESALGLVGAPLPEWPYVPALHVSAHRPHREPRTTGVVGHRLQLREPATLVDARGIPVEHPVRAWRQAGTRWALDDLIAAAEFLVSGKTPFATVDDLRVEVETLGDVNHGILRRALLEVRVGSRSARETDLRLRLTRAGLPEPEINWTLLTAVGEFVAELDLAYPRWHVSPEYDGRVHAENLEQFARDGDRWDRIRAEGWDHVRIMNHHMRGSGADAVRKVRDALIRAGWRPLS